MRWIMVLRCQSLSLTHRRTRHHWHQPLPPALTVNPPGPRSRMTRPILGIFRMPCLSVHLVTCLITHRMDWACQQIPRELLRSARMPRQNRHNHQWALIRPHRRSCSITLILHCMRDSNLGMDCRATHLVWHQMLFRFHFWTMAILRRRPCRLKAISYQTAQAMVLQVLEVIFHRKAVQTMIADGKILEWLLSAS